MQPSPEHFLASLDPNLEFDEQLNPYVVLRDLHDRVPRQVSVALFEADLGNRRERHWTLFGAHLNEL